MQGYISVLKALVWLLWVVIYRCSTAADVFILTLYYDISCYDISCYVISCYHMI